MPLSDAQIRGLKSKEKPYKVSDFEGLYLDIRPSGSKLWRLKYRFGGKEKLLALGAYPAVGLADARTRGRAEGQGRRSHHFGFGTRPKRSETGRETRDAENDRADLCQFCRSVHRQGKA
ncbi:Arm DNA-binding domain-containing protein [Primorskyibacter sp. 2E233]|uniref:Arm DNA-binding domain-containing protein n=1 Tax=Primorskyibacter sp. 2E233 TaxID=3413431 RepID=UPI003BF2A6AC